MTDKKHTNFKEIHQAFADGKRLDQIAILVNLTCLYINGYRLEDFISNLADFKQHLHASPQMYDEFLQYCVYFICHNIREPERREVLLEIITQDDLFYRTGVEWVNPECGYTALNSAIKKGNLNAAHIMIDRGADANCTTFSGFSPLHSLVCLDNRGLHPDLRASFTQLRDNLLLIYGAEINLANKDGFSPLHSAANENNIEQATCLIAYGADINQVNNYDFSPLHSAVVNGHNDMVKFLLDLDSGADPNIADRHGLHPLGHALKQGNNRATLLLVQAGADVNHKCGRGDYPLHMAVKSKNPEAVHLLVNNRANVNQKNDAGYTALMNAIQNNDLLSVKYLVQAGADKEAGCGREGITPLQSAVMSGHVEIARYLVDQGADKNKATIRRKTPLDLAKDPEIIKILEDAGASRNFPKRHAYGGGYGGGHAAAQPPAPAGIPGVTVGWRESQKAATELQRQEADTRGWR